MSRRSGNTRRRPFAACSSPAVKDAAGNRVRNGSTSSLDLVKGDGDALSADAHQQRQEFRSCLPASRRTIG